MSDGGVVGREWWREREWWRGEGVVEGRVNGGREWWRGE